MSTIADHLSDPELTATEWDLAPLLDGEEDRAHAERMLDEAKAATRFSERSRARSPTLTPPACTGQCTSSR